MDNTELNNLLTKVENIVDDRINKAKQENLIDKSGHTEWLKIVILSVFTISNIGVLFLHGTHLAGILNKLDSLETLIGIAAKNL